MQAAYYGGDASLEKHKADDRIPITAVPPACWRVCLCVLFHMYRAGGAAPQPQ